MANVIGPADPLAWAKHPASPEALKTVFDLAAKDRRFAAIKAKLIEAGIASASGRMLYRWDGKEWVKHG